MATQIEDLDVLVPEGKAARLGGIVYELPGDMPMELYLKLQRAGRDEVDEEEATRILYDGIYELFASGIAEDDAGARAKLKVTLDSLGVRMFMKLFSTIYKEDDELAADPTSPPTLTLVEDGTASTNPETTPAA